MMMKRLFAVALASMLFIGAQAQDWANLARFTDADQALASYGKGRIVLMGDSITDFWVRRSPEFFEKYGFICRGISGQTTPQMLVRFRHDVVETGARTVVILAGTNDIAGNTGPSTDEMILANISSMCDIARANGITPIICALVPAKQYSWAKKLRPDLRIPQFNAKLKAYAGKEHIAYVDYFSAMVDRENPENENGLPASLSKDGVHPNAAGYKIMEEMLLKSLRSQEVKAAFKDNSEGKKFMSFNVRNCKGMDKKVNFDRVAAVISDYNPQIVAVQELDSLTARNRYFVLKQLADRTGMEYIYAKAIDFDEGAYGIGILSREKPLRYESIALPGREERRTLLMAEFSTYIFCNTHLSLTDEDRLASVDIIMDAVKQFRQNCPEKPVFIAGDWNGTPSSEAIRKMEEHFNFLTDTSVFTFPSDKPDRTIDYIAVLKGFDCKVFESFVPAAAMASDHRPVVCRVKWN